MIKFLQVFSMVIITAVFLIILTGCDDDSSCKCPLGTKDYPLTLDGYTSSYIDFNGTVGVGKLYVKIIGIPYLNNRHTVELTSLTDDVKGKFFLGFFKSPDMATPA
ncbi:hypothetical protein ACFL20_13490, partial [Spirochaetota bacterium]